MDGTLYRGPDALAGAKELLLQLSGKPYLLMTNCPIHSPMSLADKLCRMGIDVSADKIVGSGELALDALLTAGVTRIFAVGSHDLMSACAVRGITTTAVNPQAVLIAQGNQPDPAGLATAAELLLQGIPAYCTNIDLTVPDGNRLVPHTGALVKQLTRQTGRPITNLGKPSKTFVDYACMYFSCQPQDICLIGDNRDTDIAMGQACGATTYLVLTGVSQQAESPITPTKTFADLYELMQYEFAH